MRKTIAVFLSSLLVLSLILVGCGNTKEKPTNSPVTSIKAAPSTEATIVPTKEATSQVVTNDPNVKEIKVADLRSEDISDDGWIKKYKELHPEYPYESNQVVSGDMVEYTPQLDYSLEGKGYGIPDIYILEATNVVKYTQGSASSYAADLRELGLDLDTLIKEAEIPQYVIDIGTRGDGSLVGLGFEMHPGAFFYRRSLAEKVWGTDNPDTIKEKIGGSWDNFFLAAEEIKEKGYSIVSGNNDIWPIVENSADTGWVVDGKLNIDPKREAFLDLCKRLKDNDYYNNTQSWTDDWYNDMHDVGPRQVFGFFGASWFINYVLEANSELKKGKSTAGDWAVCEAPLAFNWGGYWVLVNKNTKVPAACAEIVKWLALDTSKTGYQYLFSNGMLGDRKGPHETVASIDVMRKSHGKLDFLDGQNMFDVFIAASKLVNGKNVTEYDNWISMLWCEQTLEYTSGKKTREQAIADFKEEVEENIDYIK